MINQQVNDLCSGINFEEELEFFSPEEEFSTSTPNREPLPHCSKDNEPILQPFTSDEPKSPIGVDMCNDVSSTSEVFEPSFDLHADIMDDSVIDMLFPKEHQNVSPFFLFLSILNFLQTIETIL